MGIDDISRLYVVYYPRLGRFRDAGMRQIYNHVFSFSHELLIEIRTAERIPFKEVSDFFKTYCECMAQQVL